MTDCRELQRFQRAGLVRLPGSPDTPPYTQQVFARRTSSPLHIQQQIVRLALAHPFTARELARIVRDGSLAIDHRGIQRVLGLHRLSPAVLASSPRRATGFPPAPATSAARPRASNPPTHAQRLPQALGPEHLLLRFRTYREYPTEEQARWRIIELLEVGFGPRRVAKLLAIQLAVVYHWQRRFHASGLVGLTTRTRPTRRSPCGCRSRR